MQTYYYMKNNTVVSKIMVDHQACSVEVENYTDDLLDAPFGCNKNPTISDFEDFLEDRCFPRTRDKMKLHLQQLGIDYYDPVQIIQKTHGILAGEPYALYTEEEFLALQEPEYEDRE